MPKHIVTFSGGKDSQVTAIWCENNLKEDYEIVFCDTAWEHKDTYKFLLEFEGKIDKKVTKLKSKKYKGFMDMTLKKGSHPSTLRRFCTMELKVIPMIDYILDEVQDDIVIYQGIRWQESRNRAEMPKQDEYFKYYLEPRKIKETICKKTGKIKQRKVFDTYRKKEVLAYLEKYEVKVVRPIIAWTGTETMQYIKDNGFTWNPLYDLGFGRVGCFPCVNCTLGEVALMIQNGEEKRFNLIRKMEAETDTTFFNQGYIPLRYCSKEVTSKKGKTTKVPTVDDVIRYVKDRKIKQLPLFQSSCKNIYMPCE